MSPAHAAGAASLEGGNAFRFAQGKFPPGIPAHERDNLRRTAAAYIREVCFREGASHYEMLCVPPEATRDAIKENYHLLMALIHPDRAESAHQAWPADWAQRANRAYAVLCDDAARADYDESFGAFDVFHPPPRRPMRHRHRPRRPAGIKARVARAAPVLGVIAVLLAMLAWVDLPGERVSFNGGSIGRDTASRTERPRFLGLGVVPARDTARDLSPAASAPRQDHVPVPLWRDAAPAPAVETHAARRAAPVPVVVEAEPPGFAGEAAPPAIAAPVRLSASFAQAAIAEPSRPEPSPTSGQIEIVVARLIGYYEAGETDNLMALLDANSLQAARTRQAYLDFFRATRERRLRVKSLDWQSASATARAQGQATVHAEYVDAPGSLDRDIDVEMEIAMRNGQAKITRLTLFPNAP